MFYITYTAEENSFLLALFTYKVFAMESINAKKKKKKKRAELKTASIKVPIRAVLRFLVSLFQNPDLYKCR